MKILIIVGLAVIVAVLFLNKIKALKEKQDYVGVKRDPIFARYPVIKDVYSKIKNQADYTDKNLNRLTTASLTLMVPGGIAGVVLKNMELGLLISVVLGTLPFIYLFLLERKKQKIILREIGPFLNRLDWEYASSLSVQKALQATKENCPALVSTQYEEALQKISTGAKPSIAIREMGEATRSPIFLILSGTLAAQEDRNDVRAFRNSLKELVKTVGKTNNRLSKVDSNLNKKKAFLFMLGGLSIILIMMTSRMVSDPLAYFSDKGSFVLLLGFILMLIPYGLYLMSSLRRRF